MPNGLKTALLLGAMSGLLLFIGEALGGAQGLMLGFIFAAVMNFGSYWFSDKIVLKMYGAKEVGPEPSAVPHRRQPGAARRPADAEGLRHSAGVAQRVCDRPQPGARGGRGDGRHPADPRRARSSEGVDRARARARQAPRHPDQLDRGDDRRGDHDGVAVRDVLRRLAATTTTAAAIRSRCSRRSSSRRSRRC